MDTYKRPGRTAPLSGRERSAIWGGPFLLGVLIAALGVFALLSTGIAGLATVIFFGVLLAGGGVVEIIEGFGERKEKGNLLLHVLSGVLAVVVGGILLLMPIAGLAALTLLLGGYFIASGLFRGVTALADRYEKWGFDLFYGIVAIALGVIVFAAWPEVSLTLVGALIGIELLARGIAIIGVSLTMRRGLREAAA